MPTTRRRAHVGRGPRSNFNLPPEDYVYGKPNHPDAEGAGQVMTNWQISDTRTKRGRRRNRRRNDPILNIPNDRTFGRPTEKRDVTMRDLINANYTQWDDSDSDYEEQKAEVKNNNNNNNSEKKKKKKRTRLPKPKPTKASQGHASRVRREKEAEEKAKNQWKMKRFNKIKPKISLRNMNNTTRSNNNNNNNNNDHNDHSDHSDHDERYDEY